MEGATRKPPGIAIIGGDWLVMLVDCCSVKSLGHSVWGRQHGGFVDNPSTEIRH